ncbi:hypothetical protein KU43P_19000 [Pseudomonas sp. KU43P]|nr:hypothetical protein KU43P_19000 [Pseudomonas sp. KU43P]
MSNKLRRMIRRIMQLQVTIRSTHYKIYIKELSSHHPQWWSISDDNANIYSIRNEVKLLTAY